MANSIKPGSSSLNMDNISDNLTIVHGHIKRLGADKRIDNDINKLVNPEYYQEIYNADDTDMVNKVPSTQIAVAADESDRTTVNNALHLGGYAPEYYMSASVGSNVQSNLNSVSNRYGDDITDLRDELYMLKNELMKQGLIKNTKTHMGYTDIFRDEYKPFEYEVIDEEPVLLDAAGMTLHTDGAEKIDNNDFIVVRYKDADTVEVRQISSKIGCVFTFSEPLNGTNLNTTNVEIYKTCGISKDGNFYFAKDKSRTPGKTEYYTGLDDDAHFTIKKAIKATDTGYGYSFRIPERKLGFLTKMDLQYLTVKGMPTYRVYIIDQQDIVNFKNPDEAEAMYLAGDKESDGTPKIHFFAKSNPVTLDPTIGQNIVTFDFFNANLDGGYPIVDRLDEQDYKVKYVAIVVGTLVDSDNYAEFMFLQHQKEDGTLGDLELNNVVYNYVKQSDTSQNLALSTNEALNNSDMYYAIMTKEAIENQMIPYNAGLYTAKVKCNYPEGISRARLQLRIYREGGKWVATLANGDVYGSKVQSTFDVRCTSYYEAGMTINANVLDLKRTMYKPLELRDKENTTTDSIMYPDVIVGNTITSGSTGATGDVISITTPTYVRPDDMVYANAYIVSVKGKKYEYVESDSEGNPVCEYQVTDSKKIYLDLKAIIPDGIKYDKDVYSDRLIFEGDFTDENGMPMFFNELEFQIYWQSAGNIDSESAYTTTQSVGLNKLPLRMGIIHDLAFSTDRTMDLKVK